MPRQRMENKTDWATLVAKLYNMFLGMEMHLNGPSQSIDLRKIFSTLLHQSQHHLRAIKTTPVASSEHVSPY